MLFLLPALLTLFARQIPHELVQASPIWVGKGVADDADAHVAFRGYSECFVWLDGKPIDNAARRSSGSYLDADFSASTGRSACRERCPEATDSVQKSIDGKALTCGDQYFRVLSRKRRRGYSMPSR